jgi:two-component system, NtrC family, sensor kinase
VRSPGAPRRELAEAREQQAATAEILKVISRSPTELQRVFADIAASAARLCDAYDASIFQLDDDRLCLVAHHGAIPQSDTLPLRRGFITGRVVLERQTIHIADIQAETGEYPEGSRRALHLGHRTILAVPLIRRGEAIGAIAIRRTEVKLFSDKQIALLETFANQAVIAIENTRLFEEVQEKNTALTGANVQLTEVLEEKTATSDILSVIAASPTDVQPVFETIAKSAANLCGAELSVVCRFDGKLIHVAALPLRKIQILHLASKSACPRVGHGGGSFDYTGRRGGHPRRCYTRHDLF